MRIAVSLASALGVCSVFLLCLGENPGVLFEALWQSLFTSFGLGYSLFYTTPLLFTGLAAAICFRCGLFNIGAEGQLYIGATALVAVGIFFPNTPAVIALPLGILTAALAGGLWGGIAGWLKAKRGSHEVIVTILLNFIALSLVNYLILYPLDDPSSQAAETAAVGHGFHIAKLSEVCQLVGLECFTSTPVNLTLFFALAIAALVHFFLFRTSTGFEMRAVGANPHAGRFAGIKVERHLVLAFFLSGALAGLVGVNEVMGYHHSVIEGFSPGYGFTGLAVALLARNRPVGILFTALLFGVLQNSARELEFLSERVTKELSFVIQAVLIAFIAGEAWFRGAFERLKRRFA